MRASMGSDSGEGRSSPVGSGLHKFCRRLHVNKALLPVKALFFLQLAGVSTLLLYITLYMKQNLGMTQSEIAVTSFLAPFLGFFSRPLFGAIADRYQSFRLVLILVTVLNCVSFNMFLTVPSAERVVRGFQVNPRLTLSSPDNATLKICQSTHGSNASFDFANFSWPPMVGDCDVSFHTNQRLSIKRLVFERVDVSPEPACATFRDPSEGLFSLSSVTNFSIACANFSNPAGNGSTDVVTGDIFSPLFNSHITWSLTFLQALIWRSLGYFFCTPALCLADAVTIALLGEEKRRHYGKTRLFGSIGFFTFALITSATIKLAGDTYTPTFILYSIEGLISVLIVLIIQFPPELQCSDNFFKSVKLMCTSLEVFLFFVIALLSGMCMAVVENYVFLGVRELVDPPKYFFGIMTAFMVISETPIMALSGLVISRIGEVNCIAIGFVFWAVRFGVYSLMTHVWQVLVNELLHGITFGLIFPALVTYGSRLTPRGAEGTMQGMLSGFHFGLGVAIGGLAGGVLLDWIGYRPFFRSCSVYSLVCGLALFLLNRFFLRHRTHIIEEIAEMDEKKASLIDLAQGDEAGGDDCTDLGLVRDRTSAPAV